MPATTAPKTQKTAPAPAPPSAQAAALANIDHSMVDQIGAKVMALVGRGQLALPPNYSASNALKEAWLVLQAVKDKNDNAALEVCTKPSIANALLDMVVQGLSPRKKQCYFIVYGTQLTCMRSYMGAMTVAKRVDPRIDRFISACVYEKDTFRYTVTPWGGRSVVEHEQALENVADTAIVGAYACAVMRPPTAVIDADGQEVSTPADHRLVLRTEIMTMAEIRAAWKQSSQYGKDTSPHAKFSAEMAQKTVMNRLCKRLINASDDSDLFRQTARRAERVAAEAEIEENANNGPVIDIDMREPEAENQDADAPQPIAEEPAAASHAAGVEIPEF